jgi:hypothetical protein
MIVATLSVPVTNAGGAPPDHDPGLVQFNASRSQAVAHDRGRDEYSFRTAVEIEPWRGRSVTSDVELTGFFITLPSPSRRPMTRFR